MAAKMSMKRNYEDAESYHYNQDDLKNKKMNTPDVYFWKCSQCGTKNRHGSTVCYNCAQDKDSLTYSW